MKFVFQRDFHRAAIHADGGVNLKNRTDRTHSEVEEGPTFGIGVKFGDESMFVHGFVCGTVVGFGFEKE